MGIYAADGSFNVSVVSGIAFTGLYAADGSYNVVIVDGTTLVGLYADCGALNVIEATSAKAHFRHPSGAIYVSTTPYYKGTVRVTVVSGALGGSATLNTPTFVWDADAADPTPDFTAGFTDAELNDVLEWEMSTSSATDADGGFTTVTDSGSDTLDWAAYLAQALAISTGALTAGTYYFHARNTRGVYYSNWSATETVTLSFGLASPFFALCTDTPPVSGPSFMPMYNARNATVRLSSTSTPVRCVVPCAGRVSGLRIKLPSALTAGSIAFVLRKNTVDTLLTKTLSSSTTAEEADMVNEPTVAVGDVLDIKVTGTGTPTTRGLTMVSAKFKADASLQPLFAIAGTLVAGATRYRPFNSWMPQSATEANVSCLVPTGGTIDNIIIDTNTAPGGTDTFTATLVKNGTPTALTVTITGAEVQKVGASNPITIAVDDTISMKLDASATAVVTGNVSASVTFAPTTANEIMLFSVSNTAPSSGATQYMNVAGGATASTTETEYQAIAPFAFTLKGMRAQLGAAPGAGKSRAFRIRNNTADGNQTFTISDAATTGNSGATTDSIALSDVIDISTTPSGTPASPIPYKVGMVADVTGA